MIKVFKIVRILFFTASIKNDFIFFQSWDKITSGSL